jgi:hypothetical protein
VPGLSGHGVSRNGCVVAVALGLCILVPFAGRKLSARGELSCGPLPRILQGAADDLADLAHRSRKVAPSIIFIDEIDAVGR